MSQIDYANTKEGIHHRAKEVNMMPWTLGCQCFDCCKEFDKIIEGGSEWAANEFEKNVWNKAIDAAERALHEKLSYPTEACAIVRELKK